MNQLPELASFPVILIAQATIVTAAGLLAAFPIRSAAHRHGVLLAALVCVILSPLAYSVSRVSGLELPILPEVQLAPVDGLARLPVSAAPSGDPIIPMAPGRAGNHSSANAPPANESGEAAVDATKTMTPEFESKPSVVPGQVDDFSLRTPMNAVVVASGVWLLGSIVAIAGLSRAVWNTLILLRPMHLNAHGISPELRAEAARRLGVSEFPRVATTSVVSGPAVAGVWGQPWILIPSEVGDTLSRDELLQILVHEGAHALRRDPLLVLIQRLGAAMFWWHPLVHLVNRSLRRAREEICDNFVLQHTDAQKYGSTLLHLATLPVHKASIAPAIGLLNEQWNLEDRVRGLLDPRRARTTRISSLALMTLMGAFVMLSTVIASTRTVAEPVKQPEASLVAETTPPAELQAPTARELPSGENVEQAKAAFRDRSDSASRILAAKLLYELLKPGSPAADAFSLFGSPDENKGGQQNQIHVFKIDDKAKIELEYVRETNLLFRKREVGLGVDEPRGAVPPIPDEVKQYVRDVQAGATTLRVGFIPAKVMVVWGEPLEVTFKAENIGKDDFEFQFGGDYRGVGRHNRFQIKVTDTNGDELPDPLEQNGFIGDFGGVLWQELITPNGMPFTKAVDLAAYRKFSEPGEYTVSCTYQFHEKSATGKPEGPEITTSFRLVILPRTPERVAKVLDEYVARAKAASDKTRGSDMERIARFGKDDAVPRLVALASSGDVKQRSAALGALPLIPTAHSLAAAMKALKDSAPEIRISAAASLGRFEKEAGVGALLSALPHESPAVRDAVLQALGASKSPRALPVLIETLGGNLDDARRAAIGALAEFGGPEAISALKAYVTADDLAFRQQILGALAERLGQKIEPAWIQPILMGRMFDFPGWFDARRLTRMYCGDAAIPTLLSALDFDVPWSYRNWWLLHEVQACPNAPQCQYEYDPNADGTPEQYEKNRQVLESLKPLAGPIFQEPTLPRNDVLPVLRTEPPIDFTAAVKPAGNAIEITSGFVKYRIRRGAQNYWYEPTKEYETIYARASELRELLSSPDELGKRNLSETQLKALKKLICPSGYSGVPDPGHLSQRFIDWKESPLGPVKEWSEEKFLNIIRRSSQAYHASVTAFVQDAERILKPAVDGREQTQMPDRSENVEDIHPTQKDSPLWRDLKGRLSRSGVKFKMAGINEKGECHLSLSATPVSDLGFLKGAALTSLDLSHTPVHDLAPLEGMPLRHLDISGTQITSLEPLKGIKLARLIAAGSKVNDLSPLKSARLEQLVVIGAPLHDLSPLAGMPLKYLDLRRTNVRDLTPLSDTPLESLQLEDSPVTDLSTLQKLPLKLLWLGGFDDTVLPQVQKTTPRRLLLGGKTISNLKPLKGMRFEELSLDYTNVKDIAALADMPLKSVALGGTPVTDLTPLGGMKLTSLYISEPGADLAPLAGMPLESVGIPDPATVKNLAVLRDIRTLESISLPDGKPLSSEDFWKRFGSNE